MGKLARHLVGRFRSLLRDGWTGVAEAELLSTEVRNRYGFGANADLVLLGPAGERIVVELEISRADPVANQAKFMLVRGLGELKPADTFVSMVSSHVVRGRRNLAALFTRTMRVAGASAFQVSLLPDLAGPRIQSLNDSEPRVLAASGLPYRRELDRIFKAVRPVGERDHRIHLAGDVGDVMANLWTWNDELRGAGADLWGRRATQFFVYDPGSGLFAPSKYCAFIPAQRDPAHPPPATMTMAVYASLGEQDPRFDGHRARKHLVRRLAFDETPLSERGAIVPLFERWHRDVATHVPLRQPVHLLTPPSWY